MGAPAGSLIADVDDPSSWPAAVRDLVSAWHEQVDEHTVDAEDLAVPGAIEGVAHEELLVALTGSRLRTYHCTRLLPHELDDVVATGLHPYAAELFHRRLDRAQDLGYVTPELHTRLCVEHLGAPASTGSAAAGRYGRVWLSLGRAVLDTAANVQDLLSFWGGEGISLSCVGYAERAALAKMGSPVIVGCALDMARAGDRPTFFAPDLARLFLGAWRGLTVKGNVSVFRAVEFDEIDWVEGPGQEQYDAHPCLPRG